MYYHEQLLVGSVSGYPIDRETIEDRLMLDQAQVVDSDATATGLERLEAMLAALDALPDESLLIF